MVDDEGVQRHRGLGVHSLDRMADGQLFAAEINDGGGRMYDQIRQERVYNNSTNILLILFLG